MRPNDWRINLRVGIMAVALVFAAGILPASAQYFGQNKVQYDKFDFKVLKTEHFDIYYYTSEADAAAQVGRMAERWYTRLSQLLTHQLTTRQPIVLYGSHPEFEETNVVEGLIDEGTGGVTEGLERRVVLPLAASLGETDHVLGHELVHAFQYDILGDQAEPAPLWFIEGMAEYLSLGPYSPQTALWLRDAALADKLPKVSDLDDPQYFPYRFGHAFWAYIGGRWGDPMIGNILHRLAIGAGAPGQAPDAISVIEAATGEKQAALSTEWQDSIRKLYDVGPRTKEERTANRGVVFGGEGGQGGLNVGPSLSPDGTKIAFLSERNRLSVDLYVADAASGHIISKLTKSEVDPHFQSLQFLASSGSWSPDGKQLVVATVRSGRPQLAIFDINSGNLVREVPAGDRGEVFQPTWSPDGKTIVFTTQIGGLTDLYSCDVGTGQVKRLTQDSYADLMPTWSPDGRQIAFVTDRFTSDLTNLQFGKYRIGLIDPDTSQITQLDTHVEGNLSSPQWSRDGHLMFFVSDATGRPEVYRLDVAAGTSSRLTSEETGVTGITAQSPALSVATAGNRGAMTIFRDNGYEIQFFDPTQAPPVAEETAIDYGQLPPGDRKASVVSQQLAAATVGLPAAQAFPSEPYKTKFKLVDVGQAIGVGTNSQWGTFVTGGLTMLFSDMLGNHMLSTSIGLQGQIRDVAASAQYLDRTSRWNWGVFGDRVPLLSGTEQAGFGTVNGEPVIEDQTILYRQIFTEGGGVVSYPFSRASRVEFSLSGQHIGFNQQVETNLIDANTGQLVGTNTSDPIAQPGLRLVNFSTALVRDTAANGAVGPIDGARARIEGGPTGGDLHLMNLSVDYRRYALIRPVTFAARIMHVGRYGRDGEDSRLVPFFLGYPELIRGYDPNSFSLAECTSIQADGSCPEFDRLFGSRILVFNGEVRVPAKGLFTGNLDYGPIPTELFAFYDGGTAWTSQLTPTFAGGTRAWVASAGVGARVNAFNYFIAEFNLARPLNRQGQGWQFVFNLRPSF